MTIWSGRTQRSIASGFVAASVSGNRTLRSVVPSGRRVLHSATAPTGAAALHPSKRQAETMRFGLFHGIALKASNGHHQTEQNRDHADDAARIKHARDAQRVNHLTAQKRTSADAEVEDAREKRHGNRFLFIGRNIDDLRLVHNAHRSRAYAPQNNNAKYCRKAQTRRRMHQQQGYRHTDGDGPKERETETGIQL